MNEYQLTINVLDQWNGVLENCSVTSVGRFTIVFSDGELYSLRGSIDLADAETGMPELRRRVAKMLGIELKEINAAVKKKRLRRAAERKEYHLRNIQRMAAPLGYRLVKSP